MRITPKYVAESLQRLESGSLKFEPYDPEKHRGYPFTHATKIAHGVKLPKNGAIHTADVLQHPKDGDDPNEGPYKGTEVHLIGGSEPDLDPHGYYVHEDPAAATRLSVKDIMNPSRMDKLGFEYFSSF